MPPVHPQAPGEPSGRREGSMSRCRTSGICAVRSRPAFPWLRSIPARPRRTEFWTADPGELRASRCTTGTFFDLARQCDPAPKESSRYAGGSAEPKSCSRRSGSFRAVRGNQNSAASAVPATRRFCRRVLVRASARRRPAGAGLLSVLVHRRVSGCPRSRSSSQPRSSRRSLRVARPVRRQCGSAGLPRCGPRRFRRRPARSW